MNAYEGASDGELARGGRLEGVLHLLEADGLGRVHLVDGVLAWELPLRGRAVAVVPRQAVEADGAQLLECLLDAGPAEVAELHRLLEDLADRLGLVVPEAEGVVGLLVGLVL